MMRRLPVCILSILFIISLLPSLAQTPALRFDTLTWDFGTVAEAGGRVTHRFGFANRSGRPVVVTDAVATCGCTVPVYSKRPVLPGERSEIAVTFDPMNRPGRFDKAVSVFTSESGDPIRLRITGRVTPRERSVEELYPAIWAEGCGAAATSHAFGYVRARAAAAQRDRLGQRVVGTDRTDVALRPAERPPDGERAGAARCGERASFDFGYDLPAGCGVYGTLEDEIGLSVDGAPVADWIVVSGIAVDNPLLYSDNSAPKAEISENIVKFGPVKRPSGPSTKWISLRNTGERPLTVRAVESRVFGCTLRPGMRIAAGGEAQVGIRLTPSDCEYGVAVERIRIVTDDPERPMLTVRATAVIEQ